MLALRRGNDAQVVRDGGVAGGKAQCITVGRLGLIETSALVMRHRVGDQLIEFARHG